MGIDMSVEQLAGLYQMGSLGKLINGLIHNLNGPLQNLSMDLELMEHSVKTAQRLPADLAESMLQRLQRMQREFDHINALIRAASARGNTQGVGEVGDMRAFLDQEFSFLSANLYFKHNVQKQILFDEDLPPLLPFPGRVALPLGWFLQSLVEDLERQRVARLTLKARSVRSGLELSFITEEGRFSQVFLKSLSAQSSYPLSGQTQDPDMGGVLSIALLKQGGVSFTAFPEDSTQTVRLTIPLNPKKAQE
jgi:signal transduction histidine kinase